MKELHLIFSTSEQKKRTIKPKVFRSNLTAAETRIAMQGISDLQLFEKDGVNLYQEPASAAYIETITSPIF